MAQWNFLYEHININLESTLNEKQQLGFSPIKSYGSSICENQTAQGVLYKSSCKST